MLRSQGGGRRSFFVVLEPHALGRRGGRSESSRDTRVDEGEGKTLVEIKKTNALS